MLRSIEAARIAAFDPTERAVFEVLMREIGWYGYCPTLLDWIVAKAGVSVGEARKALRALRDLGLIEEFFEDIPYAQLAWGSWVPDDVNLYTINCSPYDYGFADDDDEGADA